MVSPLCRGAQASYRRALQVDPILPAAPRILHATPVGYQAGVNGDAGRGGRRAHCLVQADSLVDVRSASVTLCEEVGHEVDLWAAGAKGAPLHHWPEPFSLDMAPRAAHLQ